MFMKTVKVGVLRMTYQLSYGLGAFVTFEITTCTTIIITNRNISFVSALLKFIEWNINKVLRTIKDIATFSLGKGEVSLKIMSFA